MTAINAQSGEAVAYDEPDRPQVLKTRQTRREREMISAGDMLAKNLTGILETLNLVTILAPGRSTEDISYVLRRLTEQAALSLKMYVENREEFGADDPDSILDEDMFGVTKAEADRYRAEGFDGPLTVEALKAAVDQAYTGLGIEKAPKDDTVWRLIDRG